MDVTIRHGGRFTEQTRFVDVLDLVGPGVEQVAGRAAHKHHDIAAATMHVHLDDASCLDLTAMKGSRAEIQHFADHVIAERGGRHGRW